MDKAIKNVVNVQIRDFYKYVLSEFLTCVYGYDECNIQFMSCITPYYGDN